MSGTWLWPRNFNPHSHKGSDYTESYFGNVVPISIHTPTRGVTYVPDTNNSNEIFQSTLPQGEWPWTVLRMSDFLPISIHTPTRGVTGDYIKAGDILLFQSTLPQGEWRLSNRRSYGRMYFNPHSHKGSDVFLDSVIEVKDISIHTPTRGVTETSSHMWLLSGQFQSTLPQGEWLVRSRGIIIIG